MPVCYRGPKGYLSSRWTLSGLSDGINPDHYQASSMKEPHSTALNKLLNALVPGNVGLEVDPASAVEGPSTLSARARSVRIP